MDLQIRIKEPQAKWVRGVAMATGKTSADIVREAITSALREHAKADHAGRVLRALNWRERKDGTL